MKPTSPTPPKPLPLEEFPEQLRRNVDPSSPPSMRLMAARGLVPAAPREMAMLLFQLSLDADAAAGALESMHLAARARRAAFDQALAVQHAARPRTWPCTRARWP